MHEIRIHNALHVNSGSKRIHTKIAIVAVYITMKIGLIASLRGKDSYHLHYKTIIDHLTKKGHEVEHMLHMFEKDVLAMDSVIREKFFQDFYNRLEHTDLVIAECSFPSMNVGYGVAYLIQRGKSVIVMYLHGTDGYKFGVSTFTGSLDNVTVNAYRDDTLKETLDYAVSTMALKLDKRFTIIFPAHLMNRLEDISRKKKIPKAVYIRNLIEKQLAKERS